MANIARQITRWFNDLEAGLVDGLEEVGRDWHVYNRLTIANWKNKPKWVFTVEHVTKGIELRARAVGRHKMLWVYVNLGTGLYGKDKKKYPIEPKDPNGALAFRQNYNAKTRPIAQANVGDGKRSGATIIRKRVMHPGIKNRDFTKHYAETMKDEITRTIYKKIKRKI